MKQQIYVAKERIKRQEPPISVRSYRGVVRCTDVYIPNSAVLKWSPNKPNEGGARCWLETAGVVWCKKPDGEWVWSAGKRSEEDAYELRVLMNAPADLLKQLKPALSNCPIGRILWPGNRRRIKKKGRSKIHRSQQ